MPLSAETQVRDELIARMAHDVRTPISAVLTWLELLKAQTNDPQALRAVEAAQQSARDLVEIVSGVEDAQRLVAGTIDLQLAPVDLVGLLEAAAERAARATAAARAVVLERDLGPSRVLVRGDGGRLGQALSRVTLHCVTLSAPGTVRLVLRADAKQARVAVVCPSLVLPAPLQNALISEGDWPSLSGPGGQAVLDFAVASRVLGLHGGQLGADPLDGGAGWQLCATLPRA